MTSRLFRKRSRPIEYVSYVNISPEDAYGDEDKEETKVIIRAMKDVTSRPLNFRGPDGTDRLARIVYWVESGAIAHVPSGDPESEIIENGRKHIVLSVDDSHDNYDRIWCEEQR